MVTYNEYLKGILVQIIDSYNILKEINDKPGDLDLIKKELLRINGFVRVILNKIDAENIPVSDFKYVKSKFQHYDENYFFVQEIETMAALYSNDPFRMKNMRLKILEALENRKMVDDIGDLIEKL